ncbi:uncharacterized protein LOC124821596 [Vigna umbellata]|uniref:uncharacterized protein LOC124821596 n=1 Tax=Vigna umbellata TaxID=87088 RepID=UPI001F5E93D0|nr:uncharacterized protein LOC124821596 [Vigna umbellata]
MLKSPKKFVAPVTKWVCEINWRLTGLIIPFVLFIIFFSLHYSSTSNGFNAFYPVEFFLRLPCSGESDHVLDKEELLRSKIAVCLVGGARRFELTGPSIIENILKEYPNSDLFLHSPLDSDTFKFSLLKSAPNVAAVRIFHPQPLPENESYVRVLTAHNSPNGIQGLLQYFNLVEGCLTMIRSHQQKNNFTYDWVVRTRVDGYWNAPLGPQNFVPGKYLVPPGSSYGGLNDRLGIGDLTTSTVALSRLSLIPQLDSAGFNNLNSEAAFKAQLTTQNVTHVAKRLPFCVVSDRRYDFPPGQFGVPVATLSSPGPLSGAKCRPCTAVCQGLCVETVMEWVEKGWSWTEWENGVLELCDAREGWESGWEKIFDGVAGKKLARIRKGIQFMKMGECVEDFQKLRKRSTHWSAPPEDEICTFGLTPH